MVIRVVTNNPGYLPESDPFTYEGDFTDIAHCIISEYEHHMDLTEEDEFVLLGQCETVEICRNVARLFSEGKDASFSADLPDGYVIEVTVVE